MPVTTRSKTQESTNKYQDHVFVRMSYGPHCHWQFLVTKHQFEYLKGLSEPFCFYPVPDVPVEQHWIDLVDAVITDPEDIAVMFEAYPEVIPAFIETALEEMDDVYPFMEIYFERMMVQVLWEIGEDQVPDLKIQRNGAFRDDLLEEAAQQTFETFKLEAREQNTWRLEFADFIKETFEDEAEEKKE